MDEDHAHDTAMVWWFHRVRCNCAGAEPSLPNLILTGSWCLAPRQGAASIDSAIFKQSAWRDKFLKIPEDIGIRPESDRPGLVSEIESRPAIHSPPKRHSAMLRAESYSQSFVFESWLPTRGLMVVDQQFCGFWSHRVLLHRGAHELVPPLNSPV